jgi:hypothetical protein
MKRYIILLSIVVTAIVIAAVATTRQSLRGLTPVSVAKAQQSPRSEIDVPGTIDGRRTPEKIPDRVAYSLVFRLISSYKDETEKQRIKSYISYMGVDKEADVNTIFAIAEEYKQQMSTVDAEVQTIKGRENPSNPHRSAEAQARLLQLRAKRDAIVEKTVSSLSQRLSKEGAEKVRLFINEQAKRKIKMRPSKSPS